MKTAVICIVLISCLAACETPRQPAPLATEALPAKPGATPASFSWLDMRPSVGFW